MDVYDELMNDSVDELGCVEYYTTVHQNASMRLRLELETEYIGLPVQFARGQQARYSGWAVERHSSNINITISIEYRRLPFHKWLHAHLLYINLDVALF